MLPYQPAQVHLLKTMLLALPTQDGPQPGCKTRQCIPELGVKGTPMAPMMALAIATPRGLFCRKLKK